MDSEQTTKLSDTQLLALYHPLEGSDLMNNALHDEILSRQLDPLTTMEAKASEGFSENKKLVIPIIAPLQIIVCYFFFLIHPIFMAASYLVFVLLQHHYLKRWTKVGYKSFWNLTLRGLVINAILLYVILALN